MGQIILIACMDAQRGIGLNNDMPWGRFKEDMRRFKEATIGHPVIMGRKTFESLPAPLAERVNLVVTRQLDLIDRNGRLLGQMSSVCEAVTVGRAFHDDVYIIGGGEIYKQSIHFATKLVLTHIDKVYGCDTFFPEVDPTIWRTAESMTKYSEEVGAAVTFATYERLR